MKKILSMDGIIYKTVETSSDVCDMIELVGETRKAAVYSKTEKETTLFIVKFWINGVSMTCADYKSEQASDAVITMTSFVEGLFNV